MPVSTRLRIVPAAHAVVADIEATGAANDVLLAQLIDALGGHGTLALDLPPRVLTTYVLALLARSLP